VPKYVLKPKANDWGTCLCATCLNPALKYEKLVQEKVIGDFGSLEALVCSDTLYEIEAQLKRTTSESSLRYACRQKVPNPDSKCNGKISRKLMETSPYHVIASKLSKELSEMKSQQIPLTYNTVRSKKNTRK